MYIDDLHTYMSANILFLSMRLLHLCCNGFIHFHFEDGIVSSGHVAEGICLALQMIQLCFKTY